MEARAEVHRADGAAVIGGGGLGKVAIDYGYYRYKYLVMFAAVILLILLVQLFQSIGTWLSKKGDKYVATVQGKDFELPADKQEALKKMDKIPTDIIAGVRPVHIHLSQDGIDAMVDVSELMGSELHLHVNSNGKDVVIVVPTTDIDLDAVHGSHKPVKYSFKPELMHFFDKETEKNIF